MLGVWMPGPLELAIIIFVAVIIFGRNLPKMARSLGQSLVEYRKGMKEYKDLKKDEA